MVDTFPVPAESTLPSPLLVVEDEPLIRTRLKSVLHSLGYADDALIFATTLAEARACLQDQPVAMALVDLGLPDGNGIELIGELRHADPGMAFWSFLPGARRTPSSRPCARALTAMCSRSAMIWR